jgi:hypothetical protein
VVTANAAQDTIDRQVYYLRGRGDDQFLFAVTGALRAWDRDPVLGPMLQELEREADDLGREFQEAERDGGNPGQMLDIIWDHLGSGLTDPQRGQYISQGQRFQALLRDTRHPVMVSLDPSGGEEDSGRIGQLIQIVSAFDVSGGHQIINRFRVGFENLKRTQSETHERLLRECRTHPGVALLRLRCLAVAPGDPAEAASRPRSLDQRAALLVSDTAGGPRWDGLLNTLAAGRMRIGDFGAGPRLVSDLREAVDIVAHALSERLTTATESDEAFETVKRYKKRCEEYDRSRVVGLADEARSGSQEHALRDDLALYLYDQGYAPLKETAIAGMRADIYVPGPPSSFVIEAKQYSDGTSLRSTIRAAFRQAVDTAGVLLGFNHDVRDVMVVLFRRGGPNALMPDEPIRADGRRWRVVIINIAPASQNASRNREDPVRFTTEDLQALVTKSPGA